ncbi:hypothetical protein CEXT_342391 [Caerostris extrusa]|uniref:Uncharacterized protein n=1 Tax=Caerostris extrusa TaxID=172846 RepID=A0AAV4WCH0_CAEEX|nr:hypothetical protein CEXT_342391 [Caerostris extrusa]
MSWPVLKSDGKCSVSWIMNNESVTFQVRKINYEWVTWAGDQVMKRSTSMKWPFLRETFERNDISRVIYSFLFFFAKVKGGVSAFQ